MRVLAIVFFHYLFAVLQQQWILSHEWIERQHGVKCQWSRTGSVVGHAHHHDLTGALAAFGPPEGRPVAATNGPISEDSSGCVRRVAHRGNRDRALRWLGRSGRRYLGG